MNSGLEAVVIIGSGCAGLTAAIYAARANLRPIVISGVEAGGQLMLTTDVENFPGFPEGIMGPELIDNMRKQAERFGTRFYTGNVTRVQLWPGSHVVTVGESQNFTSQTLVVASGACAQWLNLPNEMRLRGHGVSSCATCDGAFFRNREIAVVGGGDSACEEANFLTRFASKVYMIHRRDRLRASKIMQDRISQNPKVEMVWNSVVTDVLGEKKVEGAHVKNVETGAQSTLPIEGLFVAIGHKPNTDVFRGQLDLDEHGYIKVRDGTRTSVEGVFSAGDVHDRRYRQAITAAASGCMAALDAEKYLEGLGH